ncbi:MAG: PPE family protein [Mycobacterium sp.]|uniref:PPE family protein n=1 Tax=Mycobacterium sp. TaxID=1785 RepID=UPI003F982996
MASPPEAHSALLSAGPGPGPLLAAAGAWTSLSTEYASAAADLGGLVGAVQSGAWQGPSAERYVGAHVPYLAWLQQASADSAGVATQHEVAATAYTSALAAMPTLLELAANHTIHGVLVATNFFGINTIPIALNEDDYVRMWVQAATAMSTYQAATGTALASAPRSSPAPAVVNSFGQAQAAQSGSSLNLSDLTSGYLNFYQNMLGQFSAFMQNPVGFLQQMIAAFSTNPVAALVAYGPLLLFAAYEVISPIATYGPMLAALPLGLSLGLGLSAGTLLPAAVAPVAAGAAGGAPLLLASAGQSVWPVAGMAPTVGTPAPAPAAAPAAGAGAPAAPAPAVTTGSFAYIVGGGGDPGTGFAPTVGGRGGAQAPAATIPAAAAGAPIRADARARRRRRAVLREHGDEFLDMNVDVDPDWGVGAAASVASVASDLGAGAVGFAGTVHNDAAAGAAGLTKLAADEFGGGPRVPMVPGTWEQDEPRETEGGEDGLQHASQ